MTLRSWMVTWITVVIVGLAPGRAAEVPTPLAVAGNPAQWREAMASYIAQPAFAGAAWGIQVVSLESGQALFEHQPGTLLSIASNTKLFIAALALDQLGPHYRLRTSLLAAQRPNRRGTLKGDLVLYGRGDPGPGAVAAAVGPQAREATLHRALEPLVEALVRSGVRRIEGDLIGDESFFQNPPYGSGWVWEDLQFDYGSEISALSLLDNLTTLIIEPGPRVGAACRVRLEPALDFLQVDNRLRVVPAGWPQQLEVVRVLGKNVVEVRGQMPLGAPPRLEAVPVPRPAQWFALAFREALKKRGITLGGKVRVLDWKDREKVPFPPEKWVELGGVDSRPVGELVHEMVKSSQNLYANLLLQHLGAQHPEVAGTTSEERGLQLLTQFLGRAGIRPQTVLLEEGSGLSRNNLATAAALGQLLAYMEGHPARSEFRDSLPVAGVDGTLQRRLERGAATGNLRAKTGSLRFTSALSGYVTNVSGERLAFALVLNRYAPGKLGQPSAREHLDQLGELLARSRTRGGGTE